MLGASLAWQYQIKVKPMFSEEHVVFQPCLLRVSRACACTPASESRSNSTTCIFSIIYVPHKKVQCLEHRNGMQLANTVHTQAMNGITLSDERTFCLYNYISTLSACFGFSCKSSVHILSTGIHKKECLLACKSN